MVQQAPSAASGENLSPIPSPPQSRPLPDSRAGRGSGDLAHRMMTENKANNPYF